MHPSDRSDVQLVSAALLQSLVGGRREVLGSQASIGAVGNDARQCPLKVREGFDLERSADAAGFQVHTRERPSAAYVAWRSELPAAPAEPADYRPPEPVAPRPEPLDEQRKDGL